MPWCIPVEHKCDNIISCSDASDEDEKYCPSSSNSKWHFSFVHSVEGYNSSMIGNCGDNVHRFVCCHYKYH